MALAGGVGILLSLENFISLSKARMMAPDGRCKAFDARADGFVRSEGCGIVVLKRLADAQADGDRILAVIRGSACNQDGRSNGMTAPNGPRTGFRRLPRVTRSLARLDGRRDLRGETGQRFHHQDAGDCPTTRCDSSGR